MQRKKTAQRRLSVCESSISGLFVVLTLFIAIFVLALMLFLFVVLVLSLVLVLVVWSVWVGLGFGPGPSLVFVSLVFGLFPCIALLLVLRWFYGAWLCCGAFSMLRCFFHVAVLFPCCLTGFFHVALPLVMLRCL